MEMKISIKDNNISVNVFELNHEDKQEVRDLNKTLNGMRSIYPWYIIDNVIIHFGGWLKEDDVKNSSVQMYCPFSSPKDISKFLEEQVNVKNN